MKWNSPEPKLGDKRYSWKFFLLPTNVNGITYWLTLREVEYEFGEISGAFCIENAWVAMKARSITEARNHKLIEAVSEFNEFIDEKDDGWPQNEFRNDISGR